MFLFVMILITGNHCLSIEPGIDSLTLVQAVDMGLKNNYSYQNAGLDLRSARSLLREELDSFSFRLNTSADSIYRRFEPAETADDSEINRHTIDLELQRKLMITGGSMALFTSLHHDDNSPLYNLPDDDGDYANSYGIRLYQPLLKGAGYKVNRAPVQISRLTAQNALYDFELAQRALIVRIIDLYYSAVKAERLVEVTELGVEEARTHVIQTKIKLEEGLVAQIDVSQAELQLSRQENALINTLQTYHTALDNLATEIDAVFSETIQLSAEIDYQPETFIIDELVQEAINHRLEIFKYRNRLETRKLSMMTSADDRLPSLDLSLETSFDAEGSEFEDSFRNEDREFRVEMGLSYTFGDRSSKERYLRSVIQKERTENELALLMDQIVQEVKLAARRYESLKKSLEILEQSVELAEYTLSLSNDSYAAGLIRNTDLLKAQDDLLRTKSDYFSTLMDFEIAKARLLLVVGRPLDPENLTFFRTDTMTHPENIN